MIKAKCFTTHYIDKWDKLKNYDFPKWIYRGQRDSNWTFKSSLQRLCDSMDIELKNMHILERILALEFKRRFHQYSKYDPDRDDNLEWLSIMRHYMAPTRLLDWNYSIYIATYFALENDSAKDGAAVWALNGKWAREESRAEFLENDRKEEDVKCITGEAISKGYASSFQKLFLVEPFINTACPVCPNSLTQRLTAQKGLFLCPGNPNITFDENIESMNGFKDEKNIIRLVIPRQNRKEILKGLYESNITRTTLFPGLDGFAKSLSVYHYSFEKNVYLKHPYQKDESIWTL